MKKIEYIDYEQVKITKTGLSLDLTVMAVVGTANGFLWSELDLTKLNNFEMWFNLLIPFTIIIFGCIYFSNRGYRIF